MWAGTSTASRLEKIAPNMATPNEPPIERKNVVAEDTTPMSVQRDRVLDGQDQRLHHHAETGAEHGHVERGQHPARVGLEKLSRNIPNAAVAVPATGHTL